MQDFFYSIVGFLAIIAHIIINPSIFSKDGVGTSKSKAYFF